MSRPLRSLLGALGWRGLFFFAHTPRSPGYAMQRALTGIGLISWPGQPTITLLPTKKKAADLAWHPLSRQRGGVAKMGERVR